jgi:multidrug efflux pump subunit AcrA (membrane-fusion protein)
LTAQRLGVLLVASVCACRGQAEPAQAGAETPNATVMLTPRALAVTGVAAETAKVTTVPETFATTGDIEFDPARVVAVNAPVSGRIRRLAAAVGDHVSAGDTLLTLENPEFLSGFAAVTAPRSGVVTALAASPQQIVTQGAELLRLASLDRVWLVVDLYGDEARLARAGVPVEATVPAFPDLVLRGRIATIAPSLEQATQAAQARVPLDNPGRRLYAGMFADVRVQSGGAVRAILVPRAAIIYDGSRKLVMIAKDSTFFASVVLLGPVSGDRVAVLRGVLPGERVVIRGGYELYNAGFAFTRGAEDEGDESQ